MLANKMESGGVPGHINVSERTRYWLEEAYPNKYQFKDHEVEVKNQSMRTHLFKPFDDEQEELQLKAQEQSNSKK